MDQKQLDYFVKWALIINGGVDILIGITLLLFPRLFAQLLQFPSFNDSFRFLAGGWGIAAISFGITRIWVPLAQNFVWETAMVGILEGTLLGSFCLILVISTEITLLNAFLAMLIGYGYMIIYSTAIIIRRNLSK